MLPQQAGQSASQSRAGPAGSPGERDVSGRNVSLESKVCSVRVIVTSRHHRRHNGNSQSEPNELQKRLDLRHSADNVAGKPPCRTEITDLPPQAVHLVKGDGRLRTKIGEGDLTVRRERVPRRSDHEQRLTADHFQFDELMVDRRAHDGHIEFVVGDGFNQILREIFADDNFTFRRLGAKPGNE